MTMLCIGSMLVDCKIKQNTIVAAMVILFLVCLIPNLKS